MLKQIHTLCARPIFSTAAAAALFVAMTRSMSAQDIWTGADAAHSTNWTDGTNWQAGSAPLPFDALTFSGSVVANRNNFTNGAAFDGITFGGPGAFNLSGNSILLSGNSTGTNNAVSNNSGIGQAVGLNLNVDWGYYTFTGNNSPGLALNGALTLNPGAVAFFDPFVTSTSLTSDSTGLISGLGGAGLMSSAGVATGLAAISAGVIQPYNGYTMVAAGGTLPSAAADNIELNSGGASSLYTIGSTTVNTITSTQAGNSAGGSIDTITNTGLLTLGSNGGIYVLASSAGSKTNFILTGGNLTAGTVGAPANFVFAVNGTTSANQAQISSVIQDNGTGGPVTVIATGNGSKFFNKANTYTGGTYITQGQLQLSALTAAGTGPVYVAAGASAVTAAGGTISNNFYLSPGLGDVSGSGSIVSEGALAWNNNGTYAGQITVLGPPATTGHGSRISGNVTGGTLTISGQITGPGTFELGGAHTATYTLANTNTNALNNWQGGLILNANTGVAVNTDLKMGANNQIPNGANAGNMILIPAKTGVYARVDLNGFNATINGLISSFADAEAQIVDFGSTNSTLTFGANDATASFAGSSTDSGSGKSLSLVKIGAGTQTFTGNFTNSGNVTVSNGTLAFQGTMTVSPNIVVASAGTFDASQGANGGFTVGANQTLSGTGTVVGSTVINGSIAAIMAVSGATTNIGILTNNGSLTINGGATNIWYVNNGSGTAGSGWSEVVLTNGQLTIGASDATPIHLKIVSLDSTGEAGNATFNSSVNQSWILVQSSNAIAGFTDPLQFVIDTSAFANLPGGNSQFSVAPDASGKNLVLSFSSAHVLANSLVNQTNNAGTTAVFTISATGATPITYQWIQGGSSVLVNGGSSASGGLVTITTNGPGTTSTLTIANVQDADAGLITVNVTNHAGVSGSSAATLAIIDAPINPNVTQTTQSVYAGGITYFTVTTGGTGPFNYVWSFNGVPLSNGAGISGANSATLGVDASPSAVGSYSVVVSNPAGSVASGGYVITPVRSVPNQVIYEPFSSYAVMGGPTAPYTWQGVTNLYNQQTGEPAYWYHYSGNRVSMVIYANIFPYTTLNGLPGYPWPGLAGNSPNCMDHVVSSSATDNDHLQFSQSGYNPGQSVYFSFLLTCDNLGSANVSDCIAAFCSSDDGTSFNLKLSTQIQTDGSYWLGLSKGGGVSGNQGVDANTLWATNFQADEPVFVVGVYHINSGALTNTDDTVSMWFDPTNSSFGTTNVPSPSLGPTTSGAVNSAIHNFAIHGVQLPGNRYFSDLRIGTTWASVTPASAPSLTLTNVGTSPGQVAVLTSQNAGNPVVTYQWYFNGTNKPALTNGPNPNHDGSVISGAFTGSLTISNGTTAELGTYTVVGTNTDPVTSRILLGSASATLSYLSPPLAVAFLTNNVVISWSTNFPAFTLEQAAALAPPVSWQIVPTNTYVISGTNNTVTVSPTGISRFFQLIGP
ncbi:MAG TPA: autotransporter-associated beta strand repeat-containing protein [Candidatus Saccharimonadales bacterium]|nr:autotransporter-associated beta strand repeat-containing protein [Candidatus Saccharimonadales bacterium]